MSTISTTRNYITGELLLDSDFDIFLTEIETFLNNTKASDDNIQDSGITAATKVANATITTSKLVNTLVTVDKINAGAVIDSNIGSTQVITDKVTASAVTDQKIPPASLATAKLTVAAKASFRQLVKVSYINAGNYSWTVPAGIRHIIIEGVGGGGGGGGGAGSSGGGAATGIPGAGGGGGGAAAFKRVQLAVTPGQILAISVASGGAAGAGDPYTTVAERTAPSGSVGGDTTVSIGSTVVFQATGGAQGAGGSKKADVNNPGIGGAGGTYDGVTGQNTYYVTTSPGGVNYYASGNGGKGGDSMFPDTSISRVAGTGGQANYYNYTILETATGGAGGAGAGAGGGGGAGSARITGQAGGAGGAGAAGALFIWY